MKPNRSSHWSKLTNHTAVQLKSLSSHWSIPDVTHSLIGQCRYSDNKRTNHAPCMVSVTNSVTGQIRSVFSPIELRSKYHPCYLSEPFINQLTFACGPPPPTLTTKGRRFRRGCLMDLSIRPQQSSRIFASRAAAALYRFKAVKLAPIHCTL